MRNFSDDKESLLASNKSIAEYNIGLQPRLIQGRAELATTYSTLEELKREFDQNKEKLGTTKLYYSTNIFCKSKNYIYV